MAAIRIVALHRTRPRNIGDICQRQHQPRSMTVFSFDSRPLATVVGNVAPGMRHAQISPSGHRSASEVHRSRVEPTQAARVFQSPARELAPRTRGNHDASRVEPVPHRHAQMPPRRRPPRQQSRTRTDVAPYAPPTVGQGDQPDCRHRQAKRPACQGFRKPEPAPLT